ncbi:MAG: hypothetical protein RIG61_05840 [Deltaproteobacteria bacterium]
MRLNKCLSLLVTAFIVGLASGCVNYQAVQDFGAGTGEFAGSYDNVFTGSYETCLSTNELKNIILDLGETPSKSPLTQYGSDKQICAPYKAEAEAFSQTSLALLDFSEALRLVIKRTELSGAFDKAQFVPQFSGIDENIADTVHELRAHRQEVITVNQWKDYFGSFYVQKSPQEVILENQPRMEATFALLNVFSDIYQVQLDNYGRNIKLLDTLLYETESRDAVKRTFVINQSKSLDRKQELLSNYNDSLNAVKESYHKIYERSELPNPHFNDPVFQAEMKEFLIRISTLVQEARII